MRALLVDSSVPLTDLHYSVFVCACVCVFRTSVLNGIALNGAIKCSTLSLSISYPNLEPLTSL